MSEKKITRREFVKQGVAAGVTGSLLGGVTSRAFGGEWDYEAEFIVIGSGAGGGPVAANLAAAGCDVLLLEAGGKPENDNYRVPAFHGNSTDDKNYAWSFFVKHYGNKQKNSAAYDWKIKNNPGVLYPRAGTLGGCTAHNAMITMYPDNSDWDRIAEITKDQTWEADAMRRFFQKVESAQYRNRDADNQRHGFDGWLGTEQADRGLVIQDKTLLKMVLAAADEGELSEKLLERVLAHAATLNLEDAVDLDPNDWDFVQDKRDGVVITPKATRNGRRNGTRELILKTLDKHGGNFKLLTHCLATQLLFKGDTNKIEGVEFLEGEHLYEADPSSEGIRGSRGVKRKARAHKEVILAGGAFNSPQLLMLSGIGPGEELRRHGIEVRVDLPGVGKNLQDRYEVTVVSELRSPLTILENCTLGKSGDPGLVAYHQNPRTHVYGTNGVVIGIQKRSRSMPADGDADLFIFGVPGDFRGYYPNWSVDAFHPDRFTWAILKGHTENTSGEVTLKSKNPRQTPEINFKYFEEGNDKAGKDLQAVLEGLKFARKLNANEAASEVVKKELHPLPDKRTDDQLKAWIQQEAWGHHASCTNKMGSFDDDNTVVDSNFNVRRTLGLRIVDASVFPRIPGLFIVLPTYMIAEKASAQILSDYGLG